MTKIIFLGSGDAFSAGGRLFSSLLAIDDGQAFLIDVGPTTLLALRRTGISVDQIDHIFLTHTHGDHLAGLAFLFLEFQYRITRNRPVTIIGASDIAKEVEKVIAAMYASLSKENRRFAVEYQNIDDQPFRFASGVAHGFPMTHEPFSRGFRFELGQKTLAVTGDTEWNDNLAPLAKGADLFVIECSFFDLDVPGHLSYKVLEEKLSIINNQRIILYHLGQDVLERQKEVRFEIAEDLMEIEL